MRFLAVPAAVSTYLVLLSIVVTVSDEDWVAGAALLWVAWGLMALVATVFFVSTYWKLVPRS